MDKIQLKRGKEESINRRHPWIFSGAIRTNTEDLKNGCLVEVLDHNEDFLAIGHYQDASIAVRILTFEKERISASFWLKRMEAAWYRRATCGLPNENTNAFRLVHGEGDDLTGLVVDVYNDTAVIQAHSKGMHLSRREIAKGVKDSSKGKIKFTYYRIPSHQQKRSGDQPAGFIKEEGETLLEILEYDAKFKVDIAKGQKTGFFLDQRDNRMLLRDLAKGKKVLNTFCYSGGFTVQALMGGAKLVHSVDASESAIELCQENILINGYREKNNPSIVSDTFEFFKSNTTEFDITVLDPPAFAKHRSAKHSAVQAYARLNETAINQLPEKGLLFTFSCSQVIDKQLFKNTILAAAIRTGKGARILYELGQGPDHPISIYHPEGNYLKGLVLEIG